MRFRHLLTAFVAALLSAVGGNAQQGQGPIGTLIIAHGGGDVWDPQVHEIAAMVETGGPVGVSFLMGTGAAEYRFQDVAGRLVAEGAREIAVVPLLVSSHSTHYDQIRYLSGEPVELDETMLHHLHMSGITRA